MTKLLIVSFAFIFVILIITPKYSDTFPASNNENDDDDDFVGGLTATDCRQDEDFLECGICPKSCKDLDPKCDSKCKAPMCVCKEGTVRATDGQCIKSEECPPRFLN